MVEMHGVYDRRAPELRKELQRLNPTLPDGGRKHKHHQWFTPEHGHPRLREHLAGVTALMRAAGGEGGLLPIPRHTPAD